MTQVEKDLALYYSKTLLEWSFPETITKNAIFSDYVFFLATKMVFQQQRNQEFVTPTPKIDQVWHEHIVYTKNYTQFNIWCASKFPGFSYIHHYPNQTSQNKEEFQKFYQIVYDKIPLSLSPNLKSTESNGNISSDFECG